jgi:hypothetical protein
MKQIYAYFGHHKCGTLWMNSILTDVCKLNGLKLVQYHNPSQFDYNLEIAIEKNSIDFLSYINADYKYVLPIINHVRGFHIVRDPRDLFVSSYFSHLYSHPIQDWLKLEEHRQRLLQFGKDEGLMLEMEFSKDVVNDHIYNWNYSLPNILELKMEDLIQPPHQKILEIFRFLGLLKKDNQFVKIMDILIKKFASAGVEKKLRALNKKISPFELNEVIYNNRFSKKAGGRNCGEENIHSHYRKGIAGDWKNHFSEEHIRFFKENFNDALTKLGYEADHQWEL